jgi:UDP-glucose 4-epimerase
MAGKASLADRVTGELIADASRLRATGWAASESTTAGLAAAARASRRDARH